MMSLPRPRTRYVHERIRNASWDTDRDEIGRLLRIEQQIEHPPHSWADAMGRTDWTRIDDPAVHAILDELRPTWRQERDERRQTRRGGSSTDFDALARPRARNERRDKERWRALGGHTE